MSRSLRTRALLDIHFVVTGHFKYNGAVCQFESSDDIKKMDSEGVPGNDKGKGGDKGGACGFPRLPLFSVRKKDEI